MSIKGFIISGQTQKYDYDSLDNLPSDTGSGLTDEIKTALLQLASKVAYSDTNGQDYYDDLYDALYSTTTFTVTNALSNCSNSNISTQVSEGDSYSATITASTGYSLVGATVAISMGGVNITSSAYNNGIISIASVTGNLIISITAASVTLSSITATFNQGSAVIYDFESLDVLYQYLVVTANWSDNTVSVLDNSEYNLSGTLTAGTSTITASYEDKSDTFTVTVTQGLPTGYTKYDYVYNNTAANANHVMNTGISGTYCTAEYEHEFTFAVTNNPQSTSYPICGVRATSGTDPTSRAYWTKSGDANGNLACNYYGVDTGFSFTMQTNTKYTTVTSGEKWIINGTTIRDNMYTENWTPYTSGYMRLWGIQTGTNERAGYTRHTMKVYGYKVKNLTTGEYYSNLVPCTNSSNVAGLYDVVLGEFRTANTASTLTAGNDT